MTDWLAHTPLDVIANNFGVSEKTSPAGKEKYIFEEPVPGKLKDDIVETER